MNDQYSLDRFTRRDASIRAADADRERIAERLRTAHAEGRLDLGEFQDRLDRCYEAKTLGQLRELVRDLPRDGGQVKRRAFTWLTPWRFTPVPLVPVLVALLALSAVSGSHVFWVWIPLLFFFSRLAWWRRRRPWAGPWRGWDEPV